MIFLQFDEIHGEYSSTTGSLQIYDMSAAHEENEERMMFFLPEDDDSAFMKEMMENGILTREMWEANLQKSEGNYDHDHDHDHENDGIDWEQEMMRTETVGQEN